MLANMVLGVCLALASTPNDSVFLPTTNFVLAWEHSIEKTRWEETYNVIKNTQGKPQLIAGIARVRGSAAGMEPPPDALLNKGWYEYQPDLYPDVPLRLTRSGFTADYELCKDSDCQEIELIIPTDGGITLLYPCTGK